MNSAHKVSDQSLFSAINPVDADGRLPHCRAISKKSCCGYGLKAIESLDRPCLWHRVAMEPPSGNPSCIKVVYVEDDDRLGRLTAKYLRSHGLEVVLVKHGEQAFGTVQREQPDVVLLDVMLPGLDGLAVCRKLRETSDLPIVLVTARGEEADRVLGLEWGADDYVAKPFSSRELLARIRAHARRARGELGPRRERIAAGPLLIDTAKMRVLLRGEAVELTSQEFALLRALAERPGRVLSRERLLLLLHGTAEEAFERSIDVHVSRLRQKLGDSPRSPELLKTVRGVGYVLVGNR